jgi:hypothetical protein
MPLTTDTDNYQKEIHPIDSNVYKSFTRHNKILVLCIDRDDDIGSKGSIETPIVLALGLQWKTLKILT